MLPAAPNPGLLTALGRFRASPVRVQVNNEVLAGATKMPMAPTKSLSLKLWNLDAWESFLVHVHEFCEELYMLRFCGCCLHTTGLQNFLQLMVTRVLSVVLHLDLSIFAE